MIRTDRYFINMDDGGVVAWTSEIAENYKYKEISAKVAMAIEKGVISWQEVVRQITAQLTPESLDEMLEKKMKLNVRSASNPNLEQQALKDNTQKSGPGDPYDVQLPENASEDEKAKAREAVRKRREAAKAAERAQAALAGTGDGTGTGEGSGTGDGEPAKGNKEVNL